MPEVTNAIFTFVRDDPVRSLGVTQDLHATAVSIMANGECAGSWHANFYKSSIMAIFDPFFYRYRCVGALQHKYRI